MALAQRINPPEARPLGHQGIDPAPTGRDGNVIAFPSPRLLLPVTLVRDPLEASQHAPSVDLAALLHSPLGVYVVDTQFVRDEIRVLFDIAPDDLDFTLHMLIATLSRATIGRASKRRSGSDAHAHEHGKSMLR